MTNWLFKFGHTLLCYQSLTQMFNKPTSVGKLKATGCHLTKNLRQGTLTEEEGSSQLTSSLRQVVL